MCHTVVLLIAAAAWDVITGYNLLPEWAGPAIVYSLPFFMLAVCWSTTTTTTTTTTTQTPALTTAAPTTPTPAPYTGHGGHGHDDHDPGSPPGTPPGTPPRLDPPRRNVVVRRRRYHLV